MHLNTNTPVPVDYDCGARYSSQAVYKHKRNAFTKGLLLFVKWGRFLPCSLIHTKGNNNSESSQGCLGLIGGTRSTVLMIILSLTFQNMLYCNYNIIELIVLL